MLIWKYAVYCQWYSEAILLKYHLFTVVIYGAVVVLDQEHSFFNAFISVLALLVSNFVYWHLNSRVFDFRSEILGIFQGGLGIGSACLSLLISSQ